ncbi:MAG: translocation/assembly module TamB domain-containing protein [Deltaproteobacteria bacterium]|nr:translocation/assembly module TamB domain-containing protein [Deltaproteobacteria bacterium]
MGEGLQLHPRRRRARLQLPARADRAQLGARRRSRARVRGERLGPPQVPDRGAEPPLGRRRARLVRPPAPRLLAHARQAGLHPDHERQLPAERPALHRRRDELVDQRACRRRQRRLRDRRHAQPRRFRVSRRRARLGARLGQRDRLGLRPRRRPTLQGEGESGRLRHPAARDRAAVRGRAVLGRLERRPSQRERRRREVRRRARARRRRDQAPCLQGSGPRLPRRARQPEGEGLPRRVRAHERQAHAQGRRASVQGEGLARRRRGADQGELQPRGRRARAALLEVPPAEGRRGRRRGAGLRPRRRDHGRLLFKDSYFTIQSGNIYFKNPAALDPEFDMAAQTEIKGYKIILVANGSASSPNLNFQSQPPLSQNDIVNLLTLGVTSSGYQSIARENRDAYSRDEMYGLLFQQSGVNKGLQQKLGVKVRVDQSTSLVPENAFRARGNSDVAESVSPKVVLQKEVTKNLNASLGSTVGLGENQERNVDLEYDFAKHWSVLGTYEDQRGSQPSQSRTSVGADIKFKLRFK